MSEGNLNRATVHVDEDYQAGAAAVWPVFLPVVAMLDARPLYHEALARTDLACGHQHLIEVAEQRGFVGEIDCSILAQAIQILRKTPDVVIGVNVSAGTLNRGVDRWLRALSEAPDVAKRIFVELTETQVFGDMKRVSAFVTACRHFGVRFALDDYESGNFDDELVRRVAPEVVKLSNVWDGGVVGARPRLSRYLDAVSRFGVSDVVVEWVDSKWKLDLISDLPVSHAQGLFVSRFLTAEEVTTGPGNESRPHSVAAADSLFAVCG